MECRYTDEFIVLANEAKLMVHLQYDKAPDDGGDEDAGDWFLELPPATTELHIVNAFYGSTHERASSHGARSGSMHLHLRGVVRPV